MKTIADALNELKTRREARAKRLEAQVQYNQRFRAAFVAAAKLVHNEGWRCVANAGFNPGLMIEQAGVAVTSVWIIFDRDGRVHAIRHGDVEIERLDPLDLKEASDFDAVVLRWTVTAIDLVET